MKKWIFLGSSLLLSLSTWTCPEGYFPKNNQWVGVDDKNANSKMTYSLMQKMVERVMNVYRPIIHDHGAQMEVNIHWENGQVNAFARQQGAQWFIDLFGGMARHHEMTPDGVRLILCHELGHHLGGAPKKTNYASRWASVEGQSDYWSAMKCFRKVYASDDNISMMKRVQVPSYVDKKCRGSFSKEEDVALCKRISMGAKSLSGVTLSMTNDYAVSFQTPDPRRTPYIDENHPRAQCRLDTIFQAALCNVASYVEVDDNDPSVGVCHRGNDSVGVRPLCWFSDAPRPSRPNYPWPYPWPPGPMPPRS